MNHFDHFLTQLRKAFQRTFLKLPQLSLFFSQPGGFSSSTSNFGLLQHRKRLSESVSMFKYNFDLSVSLSMKSHEIIKLQLPQYFLLEQLTTIRTPFCRDNHLFLRSGGRRDVSYLLFSFFLSFKSVWSMLGLKPWGLWPSDAIPPCHLSISVLDHFTFFTFGFEAALFLCIHNLFYGTSLMAKVAQLRCFKDSRSSRILGTCSLYPNRTSRSWFGDGC